MNMGMAALEYTEKMFRTSEKNARLAAAQPWLELRAKLMDLMDEMPIEDKEARQFVNWIDSKLRQL